MNLKLYLTFSSPVGPVHHSRVLLRLSPIFVPTDIPPETVNFRPETVNFPPQTSGRNKSDRLPEKKGKSDLVGHPSFNFLSHGSQIDARSHP
jgi:hypothetical protein